jgi:hypothetical protein
VRGLIDRLARLHGYSPATEAAQRKIFADLEALGPDAVPAIVAQMDDRRPLAIQAISLANKAPDAWERMRHYGPEQIVDALSAILSQMTGENFGEIENGGSDRSRRTAVNAWRIYVADQACAKLAP